MTLCLLVNSNVVSTFLLFLTIFQLTLDHKAASHAPLHKAPSLTATEPFVTPRFSWGFIQYCKGQVSCYSQEHPRFVTRNKTTRSTQHNTTHQCKYMYNDLHENITSIVSATNNPPNQDQKWSLLPWQQVCHPWWWLGLALSGGCFHQVRWKRPPVLAKD